MTTTISKWGNSQGIRLPKEILEVLGVDVKDEVELIVKDHEIVIRRPIKKVSIIELFANFDGTYEEDLIDLGERVGEEKW